MLSKVVAVAIVNESKLYACQGLIKTYEEEEHEPWGACPMIRRNFIPEMEVR